MMSMDHFALMGETSEIEELQAQTKCWEAQWVLLRGQLSPHVLFNILNGVAELVRRDPDAAEKILLDLADLYRMLLDHGSRTWTTLGEERALIQRFLALEQIRLGSRLETHWNWDTSADLVATPPFLLQPLVENAVKHGIAPSLSGGELKIDWRRANQALFLRVSNTGCPLPKSSGPGLGIRNLESRLKLAYGDRARLRMFSDGAWTVAELEICSSVLAAV